MVSDAPTRLTNRPLFLTRAWLGEGWAKKPGSCYAGHVQMDNRNGLVVNARLTQASGNAEPTAALSMAAEILSQGRVTLGADKGTIKRSWCAHCVSIESPARRAKGQQRDR